MKYVLLPMSCTRFFFYVLSIINVIYELFYPWFFQMLAMIPWDLWFEIPWWIIWYWSLIIINLKDLIDFLWFFESIREYHMILLYSLVGLAHSDETDYYLYNRYIWLWLQTTIPNFHVWDYGPLKQEWSMNLWLALFNFIDPINYVLSLNDCSIYWFPFSV